MPATDPSSPSAGEAPPVSTTGDVASGPGLSDGMVPEASLRDAWDPGPAGSTVGPQRGGGTPSEATACCFMDCWGTCLKSAGVSAYAVILCGVSCGSGNIIMCAACVGVGSGLVALCASLCALYVT
jgi:hypothetical protein